MVVYTFGLIGLSTLINYITIFVIHNVYGIVFLILNEFYAIIMNDGLAKSHGYFAFQLLF